MSMSAGLIWPEALDGEDERHASPEQPEFVSSRDCAQWLMTISSGDNPELESLGCGALTALHSDGMSEDEVRWVTPAQMLATAERLDELIRGGGKSIRWIVRQYGEDAMPEAERQGALLREVSKLKEMAAWASALRLERIGFEIG